MARGAPGVVVTRHHVFLSYCRDNQADVARLRQDLTSAGESVWWDQDIIPGQDWKLEIRQAIRNAYAVVVCLSKETTERVTTGVYPEVLHAIEELQLLAPGSIFLIPVRFSKCEVPPIEIDANRTLDRLQYVDLFPDSKRAEGISRLLVALRKAPLHPRPSELPLDKATATREPLTQAQLNSVKKRLAQVFKESDFYRSLYSQDSVISRDYVMLYLHILQHSSIESALGAIGLRYRREFGKNQTSGSHNGHEFIEVKSTGKGLFNTSSDGKRLHNSYKTVRKNLLDVLRAERIEPTDFLLRSESQELHKHELT
jgi:hypothetical protein